ncbi:TonB-dependent receptor [Helicobacter brantae]|uniref:TonB-dependent receptor n=1 Tax=Helicobacter brantae TaxID=375927 RepID=A0A3D8J1M9_9HELI|nr:TonB-dependent receptor [Helicobacter brantae]RDU71439.1 TonB-dependent receptor [Helicobacter brantae]
MRKLASVCLSFISLGGVETIEMQTINVNATQYKLDELNRNAYYTNQEMIENKGYSTLEQVMTYMPFVTFSNSGLGQNIDLRGQGASANVNTQVLLNGIGLNMLDSSHGVAPLNSLGVAEIESIEILAGGGAVMYGNGTRGGVVNITTKKRYESLSAEIGGGYAYSNGSEAKLNAKIGGKLYDEGSSKLYGSANGRYDFSQGYRNGDYSHLYNLGANLTYDFLSNHSLSLDLGYFRGVEDTTPYLRFSQISSPSKSDRDKAGNGAITTLQDRVSTALIYDYKPSTSHHLNLKLSYHYYNSIYDKNLQIMDYNYNGLTLDNTSIDQKGSYFQDQKIAFQTRYDFNHTNGKFIVGFDSIYNLGVRNLDMEIDWSGSVAMGGIPVTSYFHALDSYVKAQKWSNALYAIEKYDFTQNFSLTGGARYEVAWYGGYRTLSNDMLISMSSPIPSVPIIYQKYKNISDLRHNYALELTPKYSFENADFYFKYERGFRSPNPDNLTSRGSGSKSEYMDTNVKSETYDTFELGSSAFLGEHTTLWVALFYTLTHNEIYTLGSPHNISGFEIGNYDFTQRAGVEIASEQSFLDEKLKFSESFSYVDARILESGVSGVANNTPIPYVSNFKLTLSGSYEFYEGLSLWIQSSFIGEQKDTAQNTIPAYNLTNIGMDYKHKGLTLSFGVRNVADSLYYEFYNKDSRDEITGYAFLIGEGRSYFIEAKYKF